MTSLFDYSRSITPEASFGKNKQNSAQKYGQISSEPVVLQGVDPFDVRVAMDKTYVEVTFSDPDSFSGKGKLLCAVSDIAKREDGRYDVTVSPDGKGTFPYFIMDRNGEPVKSVRDPSFFVKAFALSEKAVRSGDPDHVQLPVHNSGDSSGYQLE